MRKMTIPATVAALSLAAATVTVPIASADTNGNTPVSNPSLSTTLQSPPSSSGENSRTCEVHQGSALQYPGNSQATSVNGSNVVIAGINKVSDSADPMVLDYWVNLRAEGQRLFDDSATEVVIKITDRTTPVGDTVTVDELDAGTVIKGANGEQLTVTDRALVEDTRFQVTGQTSAFLTDLDFANGQESKNFAWRLAATKPVAAQQTNTADINVHTAYLPWPSENVNCQPLDHTADDDQATMDTAAVLADGTEHATGVKVTVGDASDFERITGKVYKPGTDEEIIGAEVRVDEEGNVYVTLPKGAAVDGTHVDVELIAAPREGAEGPEAYTTDWTIQEKFQVPTQNFDPSYGEKQTIPGVAVDVPLDVNTDGFAPLPEGTTFEVTEGVPNWTITVNEQGVVTATPPATAQSGDKAAPKITVTYPDGSSDVISPTITVVTSNAVGLNPAYDPQVVKPGKSIDSPVTLEDAPEGTTYAVDPSYTPPKGWVVTIDPATGTVTSTAPADARPGEEINVPVIVTYPDTSTGTTVAKVVVLPTDAQAYDPGYDTKTTRPSEPVDSPQVKDSDIPEGSTFEITPGFDAGDWTITINPATGTITATPPADAKPGDNITVPVTVTYPDGSTDKTTAVITVRDTPRPETDTPRPVIEYTPGDTKPGTAITINVTPADVPSGSTYEITPGFTAPEGWTVIVNPATGDVTVTPPADAKPGDFITVPITVTTPTGDTTEAPAVVIVKDEITSPDAPSVEYEPVKTNPSVTVVVNPTPVNVPGGSTYIITPGFKAPEGWTVVINPVTGDVTVTPPADAKPGDYINVPVTVTTPEGETTHAPVIVTVGGETGGNGGTQDPGEQGVDPTTPIEVVVPVQPNQPIVINIENLPDGYVIDKDNIKLPDGWTIKIEGSTIILTPGENAKPLPDEFSIPITGGNGGPTEIKVIVQTNTNAPANGSSSLESLNTGDGSSSNRCLENLVAANSPLLWLLPIGLLSSIVIPVAQGMSGPLAQSSSEFRRNSGIKLPDLGVGSSQPQWLTEAQRQIAKLNIELGRQLGFNARIIETVAAIAVVGVLAGLVAVACREDGYASSEADANEARNSSKEFFGSSDKEETEDAI